MLTHDLMMLGEDAAAKYTQPGTAERVFMQLLYPGQSLLLAPCQRRRLLRVIVHGYIQDKEADALGIVPGADAGLIVGSSVSHVIQPGSQIVLMPQLSHRLQYRQASTGAGLILPLLLLSVVDEREHCRVL
ncbi:hypothetical protein ACSHJY_004352 [Cronobacter sakazakii]